MLVSSWVTLTGPFDGSTPHRLADPRPWPIFRLSPAFGGAVVTATGAANVGERIAGFHLSGEAAVFHDCLGFSLVQVEEADLDPETEVRIPRGTDDRPPARVTGLI